MNIFIRELKANWKSLFFWTLGVVALVAGGLSKYEGYAAAGDETIEELLALLPDAMKGIFGGAAADLTNILTFFAIISLYLVVLGAVHAVLLGTGILSKEERDKTTEFLYVKPISRARAITAKLAAALVMIFSLNILMLIVSILLAEYYNPGDSITSDIILILIGTFFIQLIFLTVGMAIASLVKNSKLAAPIAAGAMLSTFILSILLDLTSDVQWLKYFTPFKYFDAKNIVTDKSLDPAFILLSLIIIGIAVLLTYVGYGKRDLEV